jgi:hypothetical protein
MTVTLQFSSSYILLYPLLLFHVRLILPLPLCLPLHLQHKISWSDMLEGGKLVEYAPPFYVSSRSVRCFFGHATDTFVVFSSFSVLLLAPLLPLSTCIYILLCTWCSEPEEEDDKDDDSSALSTPVHSTVSSRFKQSPEVTCFSLFVCVSLCASLSLSLSFPPPSFLSPSSLPVSVSLMKVNKERDAMPGEDSRSSFTSMNDSVATLLW